MSFTVENLEFCALIIVRVSMIVYLAPFFSMNSVPRRVKAGIALFFSVLLVGTMEYEPLEYSGMLGYTVLMMKEAVTGALIGFACNACTYILSFSGQILDMEIGFSMVQVMDPATRNTATISGNLLSYLVMLILLVSNMHYFIIQALYDSFKVIPLGGAQLDGNLYLIMLDYMVNYFVIAFRIILPVFACTLVINVVLGILAKVAPQMNMFVIGMQLKVFVGLMVLTFMVAMLPGISDFLFTQMRTFTNSIIEAITP